MLRFHLLPPMHYVVATPAAVKAKLGIYYERVYRYGKGSTYAEAWDNSGARLPSSPLRHFLHSASPAPSLAFSSSPCGPILQASVSSVASQRSLLPPT